jgi:hypothetical protein
MDGHLVAAIEDHNGEFEQTTVGVDSWTLFAPVASNAAARPTRFGAGWPGATRRNK